MRALRDRIFKDEPKLSVAEARRNEGRLAVASTFANVKIWLLPPAQPNACRPELSLAIHRRARSLNPKFHEGIAELRQSLAEQLHQSPPHFRGENTCTYVYIYIYMYIGTLAL